MHKSGREFRVGDPPVGNGAQECGDRWGAEGAMQVCHELGVCEVVDGEESGVGLCRGKVEGPQVGVGVFVAGEERGGGCGREELHCGCCIDGVAVGSEEGSSAYERVGRVRGGDVCCNGWTVRELKNAP